MRRRWGRYRPTSLSPDVELTDWMAVSHVWSHGLPWLYLSVPAIFIYTGRYLPSLFILVHIPAIFIYTIPYLPSLFTLVHTHHLYLHWSLPAIFISLLHTCHLYLRTCHLYLYWSVPAIFIDTGPYPPSLLTLFRTRHLY